MIDLEIALVERFGWSLREIDETDVESLMGFIGRLALKGDSGAVIGDAGAVKREAAGSRRDKKMAFCDEVSWL